MRLLDLFCCAGGAAMGYHRAGFEVVGVDINPQPHYPFDFHQGDALDAVRGLMFSELDKYPVELAGKDYLLSDFDAIHASPPCQGYTTMSNKHPATQAVWPQLIEPTREALIATGLPYIIENVAGARKHMQRSLKLSGGMFGLGVERPRLFESNLPITAPKFRRADPVIGVYGRSHDGRRLWSRSDGTELRAARTLMEGRLAMGIGWMEWHELTEAIPPAYTEHIGRQLMAQLEEVAA